VGWSSTADSYGGPKLTVVDRLFWGWLSRVWADWRSALMIVKPETVIAWYRKGFGLFWTWKVTTEEREGPRYLARFGS
jgi:hypothetical protein